MKNETSKLMKAKDLKTWDQFKFPKQRKYRTVFKIDTITCDTESPQGYKYSEHFREKEGHLFVTIENCGQMIIHPDQELDIVTFRQQIEDMRAEMQKIPNPKCDPDDLPF